MPAKNSVDVRRSRKWVVRQFYLPPDLDQQLDTFTQSILSDNMSDLLGDDEPAPQHGWKSRVVVKAIREFLNRKQK